MSGNAPILPTSSTTPTQSTSQKSKVTWLGICVLTLPIAFFSSKGNSHKSRSENIEYVGLDLWYRDHRYVGFSPMLYHRLNCLNDQHIYRLLLLSWCKTRKMQWFLDTNWDRQRQLAKETLDKVITFSKAYNLGTKQIGRIIIPLAFLMAVLIVVIILVRKYNPKTNDPEDAVYISNDFNPLAPSPKE
ncbi:hypothetical protein BDQ12DRAFT_499241 [Crucibulum laeve]|uniref:Uncharacterized protein n=1 Tax=Crucibulum laeve TaxID=68775 RepID=A0A5C3LHP8_9AGAR|nr:hypothetical protein BDQ12DRAFT_499241 [Crucibulum laeve]